MYYIYQRISTKQQNLLRQEIAISDYCKANNITVTDENIYSDIITGKVITRENYQKMKAKLQKGDILIMLDLDRLGRDWNIIKNEWKELTDNGIYIIIVNCPLINVLPDMSGNVSIDKRLIQEMMFTLLCYVSEKEVEKIRQRTREALKAKKESGVVLGRPQKDTTERDEQIKYLYRIENKTICEIAEIMQISKSTVGRVVKE